MTSALAIAKWPRRKRRPQSETLAPYFRHGFWGRHKLITGLVLALIAAFYGLVIGVTATLFLVQLMIPVALALLLALSLLPETGIVYERTLKALFFAFFFSLAVWPNYLAVSIGSLPWITVVRLLAIPMSLIFLMSLSQSAAYRRSLAETLSASPVVWKLLAFYFVLAFVTLAASDKFAFSVNKYIIAIYSLGAIFLLSVQLFSRPGVARQFAVMMWVGLLICCFFGMWEARIGQVVWAGRIPSFLKVEDEAVIRILSGTMRSAIGVHRVQGKFTTSLNMAEFLALMTPFILHFMVTGRNLLERVLAAATLPLIFTAIVKTDSRLGMVGFGVAVVGYLFYWAYRRWVRDRRSIFAPLILLGYPAFVVLVILSSFFVTRVRNAVWGSGAEAASNNARIGQFNDGVEVILRQPWGYGIGRAAETLGYTNRLGTLTIDNYYLSIAIETGILGLIAFFGAFYAAMFIGAKEVLRTDLDEDTSWLVPALLGLAVFVVVKLVLSQQENHSIAFAMLGMAVALIHRAKSRPPVLPPGSFPD